MLAVNMNYAKIHMDTPAIPSSQNNLKKQKQTQNQKYSRYHISRHSKGQK